MKLNTVLDKIQYNVGEVSEFLWKSLGGGCRIWSFNDMYNEDVGSFVVNKAGDVLELEVYHIRENGENICYRWVHECYRDEYLKEDVQSTINFDEDEKINFVDLDEEQDCLEKLFAIVNSKEFDSRIQVVTNISDSDFAQIAKMAHEADITFNEQVNLILSLVVSDIKENTEKLGEELIKISYFPSTILEVQEREDGELFLQFTPEMLDQVGWKEGDMINFDELNDGSFLLTKVNS